MRILCLALALLTFGQTRLEFEVASIKPAPEDMPQQVNAGMHFDGAQMRSTYLSLRDYVSIAYGMRLYQLISPEWTGSQRFDISAKLPDGATQKQVPEMLQALLTDRFGLKMHREKREFPVYALEVAKGGLKMKESPQDDAATPGAAPVSVNASGGPAGVAVSLGGGSYFTFGDNRFEGKKLTMQALADTLARFMDKPVVDMTGLDGRYDLSIDVTPEDYRAMLIRSAIAAGVILPPQALRALDVATNDSLPNGLARFGLTLTSRKAPLDVIVIDSIQKAPSNN